MSSRTGSNLSTIGDICDFESGNGFRPQDWAPRGLPIIRIQNLNGSNSFNYFDGEPEPGWLVEPGDLLFAWAGVKGVSFGPTIWNGPRGVLNQHIYRIRPRAGIDKRWLYYALSGITAEIERKAHGFKASLVHVRKSDITKAKVTLLCESAQSAIATALGNWDAAIAGAKKMIAVKERAQKALMRRVFQDAEGPLRKLGQFTERVMRRNIAGSGLPLSISGAEGLMSQANYFNKRIASEANQHYILLKRGEFAYNRSSSAGYPFGAIKRLDALDEGVVSTLYLCFSLKGKLAPNSDYFMHYCEAGGFDRQIYEVAQEGARNHGLLNVSAADFFGMSMSVPPRKEQERVVRALEAAKRETSLLREQLEALRRQKRGLMQKLLNGEWRLPVAAVRSARKTRR